jgi:hypothetical protein
MLRVRHAASVPGTTEFPKDLTSMRTHRLLLLSMFILLSAAIGTTARAEVVFDNTTFTSDKLVVYYGPARYGDEVALAGTAREVTSFTFQYFGDFAEGAEVKAVVRFFGLDGPQYYFGDSKETPMPGTILWESDPLTIDIGARLVTLSVPHVVVPDVFTWAVEFHGPLKKGGGLVTTGPPTLGAPLQDDDGNILTDRVGSYDDFWVQYDIKDPRSWALRSLFLQSGDFYARVVAEPSPLAAIPPSVTDGAVKLAWKGGTPPFRLQTRGIADIEWTDIGVTVRSSYAATNGADHAFFRVIEVPRAAGPFTNAPPVAKGTHLVLNWGGGYGPFRIQTKSSLGAPWVDLTTTTNLAFELPAPTADRFFRVLDALLP